MMPNPMGPDPICTCPDSVWEFRLVIDGDVADSTRVDTSQKKRAKEEIEWETRSLSLHHLSLAERAMEQGKTWCVEVTCPTCGGGGRFSVDGPEIIKPNL